MRFPLFTMRGRSRHLSRHGLVLAWSVAGALVSSVSSSRADVATARDVGDYLMKAIQVCWNMPANTTSVANVQISLNKDGSLAGPPKILSPVTPLPSKVAEAAVRAITRCAPFPGLVPYAAHYELWRDVVLTFNPAEDPSDGPATTHAHDLDKFLEKYKKAK